MKDYDFKTLNDKEFEILAADLLSARDTLRYERFKPGRDFGVDGRYFTPDGGEVVLQSKHWATSPLEKLVKYLQEQELPKIQRLRPSKYILAISHALSRTDKNKIFSTISPFLKSPSDILGREDLNDLLAKNPEIERRHYKLWISSTTVLMHLLNKAIYERSSFAVDEILADAHLYVPTNNHDIALQKLEKLGSVIITGPAGIGKTTLADHLCLHYLKKDFHLIRISDEIREAESVFDTQADQVFYFDDFLGRNYLEALSGHEGAHIVQFIRRISKDKRKRFILTSRTTILNQGKLLLDVFQNNNLDRNEFEVTLESFTEMDRARVLYNHIWHSSLGADYIDAIYENKRYKEVIRHRNYNPRLIRFITDSDRLTGCPPTNYWHHIKSLLDNPTTVWQNPFESQTDDFGRAIVLLVALNGRPITQAELAESYARHTSQPSAAAYHGKKDFLLNLKHLTGSLLSRTMSIGREPMIDLFNPSIGDFVLRRYSTDIPALRSGFACLRSTSSLNNLSDLAENNLITADDSLGIHRFIIGDASEQGFVGYSSDYISIAALKAFESNSSFYNDLSLLLSSTQFVLGSECPSYFPDVADFVSYALDRGVISAEQAVNFILEACGKNPFSEELKQMGKICAMLPGKFHESVFPSLEAAAANYLTDSVHNEFSADEVFEFIAPNDIDDAEKNLRKLIEQRLDSYGLSLANVETDEIVAAFDIKSQAAKYFEPDERDEEEGRLPAGSFHLDEIDDLFDRTR